MTRPMYESAADRSNEQHVIERLAAAWGGEYHKLPISYRMDYAVVRNGEIASFVEIKARHMRWGQYPTVMISMSKVLTAANYAESLGLRRCSWCAPAMDACTLHGLGTYTCTPSWCMAGARCRPETVVTSSRAT